MKIGSLEVLYLGLIVLFMFLTGISTFVQYTNNRAEWIDTRPISPDDLNYTNAIYVEKL